MWPAGCFYNGAIICKQDIADLRFLSVQSFDNYVSIHLTTIQSEIENIASPQKVASGPFLLSSHHRLPQGQPTSDFCHYRFLLAFLGIRMMQPCRGVYLYVCGSGFFSHHKQWGQQLDAFQVILMYSQCELRAIALNISVNT